MATLCEKYRSIIVKSHVDRLLPVARFSARLGQYPSADERVDCKTHTRRSNKMGGRMVVGMRNISRQDFRAYIVTLA